MQVKIKKINSSIKKTKILCMFKNLMRNNNNNNNNNKIKIITIAIIITPMSTLILSKLTCLIIINKINKIKNEIYKYDIYYKFIYYIQILFF